ncbi:MAG: hypothetical protein EPN37_09950 [Chitinophagaceae bacterium]|nr:MAG: hypothetical protein EPN37_09950 [Chitinophagaceae bacterium]
MEQEPGSNQLSYSKRDETTMFPLIEEQRKSGLTVKAFCETKGIAPHSYYYWNKKYWNNRKRTTSKRSSFTRLQIQEEAPADRLFCELITASGGKLRFYQSVPAVYLQSLL